MIYQKKSPKTLFSVFLTNENYDFLCRLAGELSLAAALNRLINQSRESYIANCNPRKPEHTIGANTYVR